MKILFFTYYSNICCQTLFPFTRSVSFIRFTLFPSLDFLVTSFHYSTYCSNSFSTFSYYLFPSFRYFMFTMYTLHVVPYIVSLLRTQTFHHLYTFLLLIDKLFIKMNSIIISDVRDFFKSHVFFIFMYYFRLSFLWTFISRLDRFGISSRSLWFYSSTMYACFIYVSSRVRIRPRSFHLEYFYPSYNHQWCPVLSIPSLLLFLSN